MGDEEFEQTEEGGGVSAASCRSLQAVTDLLTSQLLFRLDLSSGPKNEIL